MKPLELPIWPPMLEEIRQSVRLVIDSHGWVTYHPTVVNELAERITRDCHVLATHLVSSGTVAVELALRACNFKPGAAVILAGYDYPGNVRSIHSLGGVPVMVDVQPGSWCIDEGAVANAIDSKTAAILVSHLYQTLAPVERLRKLADDAGVILIEDACQAPLAQAQGQPAGSWGHVSTLSFGGSKVITAGCGGAVLANEPRIAQRLRILTERPSPVFQLGGLPASALVPQWDQLHRWNGRRREVAAQLQQRLSEKGGGQTQAMSLQGDLPSLYKWGWLAETKAARDAQLDRALQFGLPCGKGFEVLKRRASFRGSAASPHAGIPNSTEALKHAIDVAERTVVLDHRALAISDESLPDLVQRLEWVWATGARG